MSRVIDSQGSARAEHMKNYTLSTDHIQKLDKKFYHITQASPLEEPTLVSVNREFAKQLGFTKEQLSSDEFLGFLNGSYILNGSIPHANAYSGHQFGYFVPNLGDGRALNLGSACGYHLQLKGAGRTKFSREGDGRAVLRSSIREYLASEAMQGLGIDTTRAVAIISSDTSVQRERVEPGSIVLRASKSWVRFGSFEFAYLGSDKVHHVKTLADFVIEESYPFLKDSKNPYEELFFAIADNTLETVAKWQSVGFMHGVMNTDNMSAAGFTIDYGPYAFMEEFDKAFICNTSDHEGRYSFENQPYVAQWNLEALSHAFSVIADKAIIQAYVNSFMRRFRRRYYELMAKKLGLSTVVEDDSTLILDMLTHMQLNRIDYTKFLSDLSFGKIDERMPNEWIERYVKRLEEEGAQEQERMAQMQKLNPRYVLKNYILNDVIEKVQEGEHQYVDLLLQIARNPYEHHEEYESYICNVKKESNIRCSCSS